MEETMHSIQSKDGTKIAFERSGEGPPIILVDGAMCYREVGWSTKLARHLARQFTVFAYDRRGRGQSGDTQPYAVEREIEDLQALIAEAGGSACLFAHSSGGALALEIAARYPGVEKLVVYEVPFNVDGRRPVNVDDYPAQVHKLLVADQRGDAVKLFLRQVGLPRPITGLLRLLPMWSKLTAIAHTVSYDNAILAAAKDGPSSSVDRWAAVTMPTLTVAGTKSPEWMQYGMEALASALPNAEYRPLNGQTHNVKPKAHAQLLSGFFSGHRNVSTDDPAPQRGFRRELKAES
jgi:pimeloyl-ACP methyl ester carboxylesterase